MNDQNEMAMQPVHRESGTLARRDAGMDFEAVLRLAVEGKDAGVLERLMTVRRELNAERAKAEFDAAMRDFQAECPRITKTKSVPDRNGGSAYKYACFEDIMEIVKPLLQKHGFSVSLNTNTESQPGWVIAKCVVTHCGGHSITSEAKFPLGTKTGIMSDTQVYAGALTFASRRVFCNAFAIVTAGEDIDGRMAKIKPAGPSTMDSEQGVRELAKILFLLLGDICKGDTNWNRANQWLWREEILDAAAEEKAPNLSAKRFREVIELAKKKLNHV